MSLLDDIAGIVGDALVGAEMTKPATLIKVTAGTRTPGSVTGGTNPTTTSFAAQGIVADYSAYSIAESLVKAGDRKVRLFGSTIAGGAVPETNDRITIEGTTFTIIGPVGRDPAGATYICQCRE